MRHQKWMEEDERTPLQKMQDQMRHIEIQEKLAVSTLEKIGMCYCRNGAAHKRLTI